jgi:hypothetical protein
MRKGDNHLSSSTDNYDSSFRSYFKLFNIISLKFFFLVLLNMIFAINDYLIFSKQEWSKSETEIISTFISVLEMLSSILFWHLAFRCVDRREDKIAGNNVGIFISNLGCIKSGTKRIKKCLENKINNLHKKSLRK